MNDLNSVLIEGKVVSSKALSTAKEVCEFTIMSLRTSGAGHMASFFDVLTKGQLAQISIEYLVKGSNVRVVGKLIQVRTQSQSKVVILAEHVEIKSNNKGGE